MKDINQMIANLSLDWREAADLRQAMADFEKGIEKDFHGIFSGQSQAFKELWGAIRIACNRSVNEKRPTIGSPGTNPKDA